MAVRTGKGKADKGMSTSIREGVRLPEQGGGHAGKKVPKDTYPTVPGKGNNRMLRRIRPATPERKNIRRREAGKQRTGREGAGNSTPAGRHASGGGTAGHGRQTAKKISRNYLQVLENIVSLHSQYQNGALVQLVRIRACHARGQGFESPTHRQQTGEEISGDKKQETRQFTTASFFVSPHRMGVRMGKGEADKGTSASIRVRCRNVRVSRQPACRAKPEPGMKLSGRLRRIYKQANTIPHEIRFR